MGWGPLGWGYLRPVQFLDHLTVIKMTINYQMPRQLEGFQGDDIRILTLNVDKKTKRKANKTLILGSGKQHKGAGNKKLRNLKKNRILTLQCQRNIN